MSVNVNDAISKAREAGLYVIALDTPTDPPDVVDITFATDNCLAGEAIGQWAAGKLNGDKAIIAELVIFNDRVGVRRLLPRERLPQGHGHRGADPRGHDKRRSDR